MRPWGFWSPYVRVQRFPYEFEATALFDRFTTPADDTRRGHINTLIKALKAAGVWAKLDHFSMMAAHDAQAARLNWLGNFNNWSAVASPIFTTDRGYKGDRAAAYLDVLTPVFTQASLNSITAGRYVRTAGFYDGVASYYGLYMGSGRALRRLNASTSVEYRANDGTTSIAVVASQTGDHAIRRASSGTKEALLNGAVAGSAAVASTVMVTVFRLFNAVSAGFGDEEISYAYFGAALTDAELVTLKNACLTYLQAVGAA